MKIIGSDYDGTLNHGGIDEEKKAAIARWRKEGNIFAIISGRGTDDLIEIYKEKELECDYLIATNGAVIMTHDKKIVSDVRCDGQLTKPLLEFLLNNGCPWAHINTDIPCRVFRDSENCKKSNEYTLDDMPEIPYFNQISTALSDVNEAAEVTDKIKKNFSEYFNPLQNGTCIDIVRADMNKATGLYILADIVGANYEDIIAVGDNINDRDMIAEFRSYAMANGVDEIKALADNITTGITELIKKEL